jgi:hypothetical protein
MNKKPIGIDIYFKEIFPGDTIKDASGKSYTVTPGGSIKPLDGGNETTLSKIDQPMVCDGLQEKQPTPAPVVRPVKIMERKGKANKSGLVSLGNLARKLHTKQAGFARTLREGGVEVVKGKNGYSIRKTDLERAEQLLAPLAAAIHKEGQEPAKKKRKIAKQPAVKINPVKEAQEITDDVIRTIQERCLPAAPAVDFDAIQEAEKALSGLDGFDDQQLADELRRRGYEQTATKTVTVTL